MYTLWLYVCLHYVFIFLFSLKESSAVQVQILVHQGWMQPSCQAQAQPLALCYANWWESHHCQRPIFFQVCFQKPTLPFMWALHVCGEHKERCPAQTVKLEKNLQIHLLRSVTVRSSRSQEAIQVGRDFRRSAVQPPAPNSSAFLIQSWYKWMQKHCVFCSPPTYFSPKKVIQSFLLKTIILLWVPFPHCFVSCVTKWQDALKSLTHEFLQNNKFQDEEQ